MNCNIPKISIIVPIFNVELYLNSCLDSLVNQTLFDIEIILVDDGSTDGGGEICDKYTEKDHRFRVIHKSNEGLSAARNNGIDASTAPYLLFVDADDWIEPDLCEKTYNVAIDNNADLVLFTYNQIIGDKIISKQLTIPTNPITAEEAIQFNTQFAPAVWLGLYRKELFDNIRFPIGKIHEDYGTTHRLIHEARAIYLINNPLYNYRIGRPGSIDTENRLHPDLCEMLTQRVIDLWIWGYKDYIWNDLLYIMIRFGCTDKLLSIAKEGNAVGLNWKRRVMLEILKISPTLFDAICIATGRRVK